MVGVDRWGKDYAEFQKADATKLPFADETFDAARLDSAFGEEMMKDEELQFDRTCHVLYSKPWDRNADDI